MSYLRPYQCALYSHRLFLRSTRRQNLICCRTLGAHILSHCSAPLINAPSIFFIILSVGCRHFSILSIGYGCKTSILVAFWIHVLGRKPLKSSKDRGTL